MVNNGISFPADHRPYWGFIRWRFAQSLLSSNHHHHQKGNGIVNSELTDYLFLNTHFTKVQLFQFLKTAFKYTLSLYWYSFSFRPQI